MDGQPPQNGCVRLRGIIRIGWLLLGLLPVLSFAQTATNLPVREWGPVFQGYALSIMADNTTYSNGQPVLLTITLKNAGTNDINVVYVPAENPFRVYDIQVTSQDGKLVPTTAVGEGLIAGTKQAGSFTMTPLKAQGETSVTLVLDKYFNLTLPGRYDILVTREVRLGESNTWIDVLSNEIEIGVTTNASASVP